MAETLEGWIERLLTDAGGTNALSRRRSASGVAAEPLEGSHRRPRERAAPGASRDEVVGRSLRRLVRPWAKISALIADYADKIEKLNADINNDINPILAIFSFWFEVAPKHLQLRARARRRRDRRAQVNDRQDRRSAASIPISRRYSISATRDADGSLYVVPAGDAPAKRARRPGQWKAAAVGAGAPRPTSSSDPDDAATLKQRWDKLKDDSWIKDGQVALDTEPP